MKAIKINDSMNLSRLFDNFLSTDLEQNRRMQIPSINIVDNDTEYIIEVAAPGREKNDFKVNLEDDVITVSASLSEESEIKNRKYIYQEFSYDNFSGSINIPKGIDKDKIEAKYHKGLLDIVLPKKTTIPSHNTGIKVS